MKSKSPNDITWRQYLAKKKIDSGLGQYDSEYANCGCFWGKDPAKFVRKFVEEHHDGYLNSTLDLGAGEGKNSFYLHENGFDVTAVEISRFACRNFIDRMIQEGVTSGIRLILGDASSEVAGIPGGYDLVVSYGLLHCFTSLQTVRTNIKMTQQLTNVGGYNVVSAFTDELPIPAVQDYLSPTLLDSSEVLKWYNDWEIIEFENDIITECHPTSQEEHQHSLFRMIAKRNAGGALKPAIAVECWSGRGGLVGLSERRCASSERPIMN